jgi:uncharacterized protein (DUF608 family)
MKNDTDKSAGPASAQGITVAGPSIGRRDFLRLSAQASGVLSFGYSAHAFAGADSHETTACSSDADSQSGHSFNGIYRGSSLDQIAFPIGGMGAGNICLEGTGALSKFSLRHRPELTTEHRTFAAVSAREMSNGARVLEGPVATWKLRPQFPGQLRNCWALPRFRRASFEARFPFATVRLNDEEMPLEVELTGWSPFSPGDSNGASLPVACLEYRFSNRTDALVDAVFSFNTENFMALHREPENPDTGATDRVLSIDRGFLLFQPGEGTSQSVEGHFAVWVDDASAKVNHVWFRGDFADQMHMIWSDLASGKCECADPDPARASPGASLFVPFKVAPNEARTIVLHMAWYVPRSDLYQPTIAMRKRGRFERIAAKTGTYQPWYAGRFSSIHDIRSYWQGEYLRFREGAAQFSRTFFASTLPPEVLEAVAANLCILKSPTVLRQIDGRLWGWEGSDDEAGSCWGSCTHVWNYAQAIPHLFPDLERGLRETEFGPDLGSDGFQAMRAALPIRSIGDTKDDGQPSAADGQLSGIIKVYRDWRISGDTGWLSRLWPKVRASLDYCIRTWDPGHQGWIEEPHYNTYDAQFWGADSLCTSLYLGALKTAVLMGQALGKHVDDYSRLFTKCRRRIEQELFNGEYFFQRTEWRTLRTPFPPGEDSEFWGTVGPYLDTLKLAQNEGPPYQYGEGCLAAGVLGAWLCLVCGGVEVIDREKVESHLMTVYRHNLKSSLKDCGDRRAVLGFGEEAGLLVCTWPRGGRPSLPFNYANEVWTGIEYQVASHLIALGRIEEGLNIVRACRRRYDGRVRNPFAELEAGHWYARAMSSYALLQAFSGARYDAVDRTLYLSPRIKGDFQCFLSTATGFAMVGLSNGEPFVKVVSGQVPYSKLEYTAAT